MIENKVEKQMRCSRKVSSFAFMVIVLTSWGLGGENVLARLSELMFVEAIRRYLETLPPAETGWLAGLRDPEVGQSLAALHG